MRAAPDQQQRLLELQAIDTRLQQLEHRRATLPAIKEVEALDEKLTELNRTRTDSQTAASDLKREVSQAESEVTASQNRLTRNLQRIESGTLSAKDAMAVAHDIDALRDWISTLEETQLDAMERLEAHELNAANIESSHEKLVEARVKLVFERDNALAEIDQEIKGLIAERAEVAGTIFTELTKAYDTVRSHKGGIGAARLAGGKCEGCGLSLPPADLEAAFAAAPDEVVRCEECGRILVRQDQTPGTPSSTAVAPI